MTPEDLAAGAHQVELRREHGEMNDRFDTGRVVGRTSLTKRSKVARLTTDALVDDQTIGVLCVR